MTCPGCGALWGQIDSSAPFAAVLGTTPRPAPGSRLLFCRADFCRLLPVFEPNVDQCRLLRISADQSDSSDKLDCRPADSARHARSKHVQGQRLWCRLCAVFCAVLRTELTTATYIKSVNNNSADIEDRPCSAAVRTVRARPETGPSAERRLNSQYCSEIQRQTVDGRDGSATGRQRGAGTLRHGASGG